MRSLAPQPPPRRPRGYEGFGHETIGSDIISVVESLHSPYGTLGAERMRRLNAVRSDGWYPIGDLLELMEVLDQGLGAAGLQKLGRTLFRISHEERTRGQLRCARDVVFGLDQMYHHANRGRAIGGWRVVSFQPGRAEVEKTTPHHCQMEEGIVLQALASVRVPAEIVQPRCFRRGDDLCLFVITSEVKDRRWGAVSAA